MATQAPTEFEDLTTCTVCLEIFTRPKRLPCEHSYCYACLLLLGKDKTTITCPYCQEEHEIPDSGVSGFKDNLLLNNLVGMTLPKTEICADCKQHPSADHACEHCQLELCSRCLVEHSKLFTEFSVSLTQLKENLSSTSTAQDGRHKLATHRNNLEGERRKMNELFRSEAVKKLIGVKILLERANFMDKAMGNVTELYEVLENEDREAAIESYITKLLGKSSECVTADSLTDLRKNLTDLKTVLRLIETQDEQFEFRYSLEEGFQQLEFGQAVVNVKGKYQTENIVDQITQLVQDSAGILRDHVTTTCPPRADHVVPLPAMTKTADADTQTENRFQEPEPEKKITDGSAAAVRSNSSPKQGATLKPKLPAVKKYVQNQLPRHVDYGGKDKGEAVVIGQGESVKEENRLRDPRGCAYHVERDEILVADLGNDRIMAYRADGTNARVVCTDVRKPWDVAVSSDGNFMYIAAIESLIKVDMDGHTVRTINKFSLGDFRLCCSVTCYQEYTVVVDHGHECVIVYNDREEELRCFGQGHLKYPLSVAISDERKFYVADWAGSCVKVFDWSGEYLQTFAGTGSTDDIWGIAVDGDGNVCISRCLSNRIDIYNPQKKLVTSITGAGPGELKYPWRVCLTPDGRLLVADHGNNRVQVF